MKKGLTLIELLVVVTIISLFTLLGVLVIRRQISKAHDAERRDDLHRLAIAFEEYYSDENCYPPADILQNCGGVELSPYLSNIPCDPVYLTPYCYIIDSLHPNCFKSFKLLAHFDNSDDPDIAALNCQGGSYCGYETQCQADTGLTYGFNWGVASGNVIVANPDAVEPSPGASPSPDASPSPGASPSPFPSSSPSASPQPSDNPEYSFYCQNYNNCTQFDINLFTCSPSFSDPNCTGSRNCTTQIGSCVLK